MSTSDLVVRLLAAVASIMVAIVAIMFVRSLLAPLTFWLVMAAVATTSITVLYNSLYFLKPGQMIAFYLFGTWTKTVVTATYYGENRDKIEGRPDSDRVRIGLFGWDVALGLWPFVKGFILPTTTFEIPIRAASIYTRAGQPGEETLPRIRLSGDGTLQISLHPVVKRLGTVVPIFYQGVKDLAEIVPLADVPPGPDGETVRGPAVANLINGVIKKPMLQAMRTAAAQFTWGTDPEAEEGDTDIVSCRDEYEWAIQRALLQVGSVFLRAGLLLEPDNDPDEPPPSVRTDKDRWRRYRAKRGESLIDFDVVVELIRPEPMAKDASELEKAIDLAYIGFQEGARERAKERLRLTGQAEGFKKMANELGVTEEKIQLVLLEAIRQGKIDVTAIGGSGAEGLLGLVSSLISKAKVGPPPGPTT